MLVPGFFTVHMIIEHILTVNSGHIASNETVAKSMVAPLLAPPKHGGRYHELSQRSYR